MKTAIVYSTERLKINGFFAESLASCLKGEIVDETVDASFDRYIFRVENHALRDRLERAGKFVSNNGKTGRIGNDKYLSYRLAEDLGLPVLPYSLLRRGDKIDAPCVVKSRFGHGGKQVFWVNTQEELDGVFSALPDDTLLAQQPAKTLGVDLRVYMLGDRVFQAMLRENKRSFKSNFTLGGSCRAVSPTSEIVAMAVKIARALRSDFIGVDFLFQGETPVFGEIEDVVGTRMLYQSGIDAARVYADYLSQTK